MHAVSVQTISRQGCCLQDGQQQDLRRPTSLSHHAAASIACATGHKSGETSIAVPPVLNSSGV